MKDLAFADVVTVVQNGNVWVPDRNFEVVDKLDLDTDKLIIARSDDGHKRVVWFLGPPPHRMRRRRLGDAPGKRPDDRGRGQPALKPPADLYPCGGCGDMIAGHRCAACGWVALNARTCDICGHLLHPDEPTRCLNCGNEVPRDPTNPVLDS